MLQQIESHIMLQNELLLYKIQPVACTRFQLAYCIAVIFTFLKEYS